MRVYLCRHAEAAPGKPDDTRELTADGRAQARALGARLASLPEPPAVVVASPLVRARQTAEAIVEATGASLHVDPALGPGATDERVRRALQGLVPPVATVGHQPDCSQIALAVTGSDPGFAPGAMAQLDL